MRVRDRNVFEQIDAHREKYLQEGVALEDIPPFIVTRKMSMNALMNSSISQGFNLPMRGGQGTYNGITVIFPKISHYAM